MWPLVSVVVPCRNEEHYIERCLESIVASTYPKDRIEVLVCDGRSDDRTRDIVATFAARYDWIRLLDNPGRIAPTALNVGIRQAHGDLIVRMDAHAIYPPEYVTQLVAAMHETNADNVGGRLVTLPADASLMSRAIARALSHPFGVGNAYFRIGARERRWADTVPFGCYRREVFGRIGMFDEELVRNQDDEFNSRLVRRGGRVLLDPAIVAFYYARSSLRALSRMFYQYGLFKPLVARKVGRVMTVRQLVPPALLAALLWTGVAAIVAPGTVMLFAAVLGTYLAALMAAAIGASAGEGPRFAAVMLIVFATLHASYGFGFLRGLVNLAVRRRNQTSGPTAFGRPQGATASLRE
jgi:glycosyltransferase involved in cell wall biosynthesis